MRLSKPLLLLLFTPALLTAQEPKAPEAAAAPPPLTEYQGRVIAQTMHWSGAEWLIRRKREREESTTEMRAELKLKPGMAVCDMGSGNGYHTVPIAQAVGDKGKVYAVEVQPEMLQMLRERVEKLGLTNIESILGEYHDPKLPPNSCDMILLVDVYHEFSHPVQMLAGMRKALKPDGVVVMVEFRAEDAEVPIKPEHKMTKAQVNKELTANGFKLVREYDGLPWQHMMFFGRAD